MALEIPLPSIETGKVSPFSKSGVRKLRMIVVEPNGPVEMSTARTDWHSGDVGDEWEPCPIFWRLTRTFRGDDTDALAEVPLNINQISRWSSKLRVFPGFLGGHIYTFTPPFFWATPSLKHWNAQGVTNYPNPTNDLHHSMMDFNSLESVLEHGKNRTLVGFRHSTVHFEYDLRELVRWANAHNPQMAVYLDQWFERTNFRLQGIDRDYLLKG